MYRRVRQVRGFLVADVLDMVRFWPVSFFTIGLTSFYYLMLSAFVAPDQQVVFIGRFVGLAVLGVTLFQFSTRASAERLSDWHSSVKAFAFPLWVRFTARVGLVFGVSLLASVIVCVVGALRHGLHYDIRTTMALSLIVPLAVLFFAPLGACLGVVLHPRLTPVVVTVLYLGNAWAAGLWSANRAVPVGSLELAVPIVMLWDLSTGLVALDWVLVLPRLGVVVLSMIAGFSLAAWLSHRDEGEAYR